MFIHRGNKLKHELLRESAVFKNLAGITNLLKNAGQIGEQFNAMKDQLRQERVTGISGGGMVHAELNGLGEVLKVTIDPDLVQRQDTEMIETLVQSAMNEAGAKAREKHAESIKSMVGGLDLPFPGIDKMLEGLSSPD